MPYNPGTGLVFAVQLPPEPREHFFGVGDGTRCGIEGMYTDVAILQRDRKDCARGIERQVFDSGWQVTQVDDSRHVGRVDDLDRKFAAG